jgi:hypothetical protein
MSIIQLRQQLYKCPRVFEDMEYYVTEDVHGLYNVRLAVFIDGKKYQEEMIRKINDWSQQYCVYAEQLAFNVIRRVFDAHNRTDSK